MTKQSLQQQYYEVQIYRFEKKNQKKNHRTENLQSLIVS